MKKNQEEMNIADNPLYHDTWKLLKKYRDVVWSLELSVQQVRSRFEIEYGSSIEDFLESVYVAGVDLSDRSIEHHAKCIERSHRMLKLLDTSIDLLRTKHKNGENYYWLLYYSFLSPHCRMKLLTTGTSTRNNISEFAPQLELLYNNSINMISWNQYIYHHDKKEDSDGEPDCDSNPYFGQPIPAYKKGYSLFAASHLPEKVTVFRMEKRTQDIYNADILSNILGKTVITRTFEEVSCKNIKEIHQVLLQFPPEEKEVYLKAIHEFHQMRENYFASTGNSRKDSMMRLVQQIILLLRIGAAPDTVQEYTGDTPVKVMAAIEMAAEWENEIIAIGVRHVSVLESYEKALREYLPDRPLFVVTGSDTSFAKRRALRQTLQDSGNGILLCTQQSLPSSVNFDYVNKVIIPELHYNNSGMSQFYFRFIRYTSTEHKDIYFLTYAGSIESNLMQMILAKEKLNLFMKGQDVDLDEIYDRFSVDYDLLSLLMRQERDENGILRIHWGEQRIA